MTITVVGHGYVGLVTACIFADLRNTVYVIGRNAGKLKKLEKGDPLFFESRLAELLQEGLDANRLFFTTSYTESVPKSEIVFIAVGTPAKKNGQADLSAVFETAKKIGKTLKNGYTVIACKSTVPVGTNKKIEKLIKKVKPDQASFDIVSCPEFLREGTAVQDTLNPDRIVIGTESRKAAKILLDLHQPLSGKKLVVSLESAELIKYAANSILATKVSFANLVSFLCQKTGADVSQVLAGVGLDKRVGRVFMRPGVGYGGSCLPKDVVALVKTGQALTVDMSLLKAVDQINKQARYYFVKKIEDAAPSKNIGIWGLSFKPNTDDIREAPSVYIIEELLKKDFKIKAYDPAAMDHVRKIFAKKITYCKNPQEAVKGTSALLILTEWDEFKQIDLLEIKKAMKDPVVVDGRGIYDSKYMVELGFKYFVIGKKN